MAGEETQLLREVAQRHELMIADVLLVALQHHVPDFDRENPEPHLKRVGIRKYPSGMVAFFLDPTPTHHGTVLVVIEAPEMRYENGAMRLMAAIHYGQQAETAVVLQNLRNRTQEAG